MVLPADLLQVRQCLCVIFSKIVSAYAPSLLLDLSRQVSDASSQAVGPSVTDRGTFSDVLRVNGVVDCGSSGSIPP